MIIKRIDIFVLCLFNYGFKLKYHKHDSDRTKVKRFRFSCENYEYSNPVCIIVLNYSNAFIFTILTNK